MDKNIRNNIETIQNGAIKKGSFNFKDVHIFTMPKGVKKTSVQKNSEADSAKKTGFIILVFGSLFLILLLAASYYFFVMKPGEEQPVKIEQASNQDQAENKAIETKENTPKKNNVVKEENNELKEIDSEKEIQNSGNNQATDDTENIERQQEQDENKGVGEDIQENTQEKEQLLVNIIDGDSDGLSLKEELAVGTSDSSPDTDSDSYLDLAEMLSGYNPLGEGLIIDNVNFKKYVNSQYSFAFHYPKSFKVSTDTNDAIILDLGDEEFFQLFIEANNGKLNIEDWYKNQFGVNTIDSMLIFTKGDWNIVKNEDLKSIFFKNNRDDYVIAYNYSTESEGAYQNIFEIVFNTFEVLN